MSQRSRTLGFTALTTPATAPTANQADEALRRVTGEPAPIKPPSNEFLADIAHRLAQPYSTDRVFTPKGLRHFLTMAARLVHNSCGYNHLAQVAYGAALGGDWNTKAARERAARDARDLADLAWDDATEDAEAAFALLHNPAGTSIPAAVLLGRVRHLIAQQDRMQSAVAA
ncbi:hypothetical protein ACWCPT_29380 [Streptomyces sp. NPDC002308]